MAFVYDLTIAQGITAAFPSTNKTVFSTPSTGTNLVLPGGTKYLGLKIWSGGGGAGRGRDLSTLGGNGGAGSFLQAILEVYDSDSISLRIGGRGFGGGNGTGGNGGINGGGGGGAGGSGFRGGGGGGYSGVFVNNNPIVILGGGGGGGASNGSPNGVDGGNGGSGSSGASSSDSVTSGGTMGINQLTINKFLQGSSAAEPANFVYGGGGGGGYEGGSAGNNASNGNSAGGGGGAGTPLLFLGSGYKNTDVINENILLNRGFKIINFEMNATPSRNALGILDPDYIAGVSIGGLGSDTTGTDGGNGLIVVTY